MKGSNAILILILAIVVVLVARVYVIDDAKDDPISHSQPAEQPDVTETKQSDPVVTDSDTNLAAPASDDMPEAQEREQQIAEAKAKLDELMLEYNENLKNPAARKELEADIAVLMKEYNELILPVALEKIKQANNSQS